jgi:DNA helicase-2/ATP-dependent DNA helicase PcrA
MVAGLRVLPLLPGVGPRKARQLMDMLLEAGGDFQAWSGWQAPARAAALWPELVKLLSGLAGAKRDLPGQIHRVRTFYQPLMEERYDHAHPRARDLEQLEQIASRYGDRRTMLAEITLDPPSSTQDLAGPPLLDDDWLVLSTIHSAKGLEWDCVYVIHAADGNIPSDMATGSPEEIEEERRLFYVALTRAKNWLAVCYPLRYYRHNRGSFSDSYGFAQPTRFLPEGVCECFEQRTTEPLEEYGDSDDGLDLEGDLSSRAVRRRTKDLWS